MTSLEIDEQTLQVADVEIGREDFTFVMADGRRIVAPLWWHPRLHAATPEQRGDWEILPFGDAVGWHEIDEYVSAKALLADGPAPGATAPLEAAE